MAEWLRTPPKTQKKRSSFLQTLDGHTYAVNAVSFSLSGQLLASGLNDKTVRLWDVAIGLLLYTLEGHTNAVRAVTFPPNLTSSYLSIT